MKSISASLILLGLIYLGTQVASSQYIDHHFGGHQSSKEFHSNALRRALDTVKFGLHTLRNKETLIKNMLKLETLGFVQSSVRNCNFTDIEAKFALLVEVSVDFASDASNSLEEIFDKLNICASASFPKSISCFLNLVKSCQPDIDAIKADLQEFTPKAQKLANNILLDISICYHW